MSGGDKNGTGEDDKLVYYLHGLNLMDFEYTAKSWWRDNMGKIQDIDVSEVSHINILEMHVILGHSK